MKLKEKTTHPMGRKAGKRISLLIPCLATIGPIAAAYLGAEDAEKTISFARDVRPLLEEKCAHCHNRKTLPEQVSFESAKLAFQKNKKGQVYFVPGDAKNSLIMAALDAPVFHEKAMPMVGPRPSPEEIEVIRKWIDQGAEWPKGKEGRIKPTHRAKE